MMKPHEANQAFWDSSTKWWKEKEDQRGLWMKVHEDPTLVFAKVWNVIIERYYHEEPTWSFLFRHPRGGVAKIDLKRIDDELGCVRLYWWRDSYEEGIRFLRSQALPSERVSRPDILLMLDKAMRAVLEWDLGDLQAYPGYKETWQKWLTREDFDAQERQYPLPTVP